MKKFDFDKKFVQIAILTFIVIISCITYDKTIGNIGDVIKNIGKTFSFIAKLLQPFVIGFCIAFILNPAIRTIENTSIREIPFFRHGKRLRIFSIFSTYVLVILFCYFLISTILPSVFNSINTLVVSLPAGIEDSKRSLTDYVNSNNSIVTTITTLFNSVSDRPYSSPDLVSGIMKPINQIVTNLPNLFSTLLKGTLNFANVIFSIVLGFVISIYFLSDKEYFAAQSRKIVYVVSNKKNAERAIRISSLSATTLEKFIVGKAIDSFIIGALFFIICLAFKIQYASLFALIIGITNMIPYFGPFIGAIPVLIITGISDFSTVIPLAFSILILQQFDGIILGPKILGDSIGLKPISIILSIIIGGGIFGPIGMFLGAPIYAVISTILSELMNRSYESKGYK